MHLQPISIYIHIPWCIKKCPYCDFNSHGHSQDNLPEEAYINALINDFEQDLPYIAGRTVQSIFIGGGTPSIIQPKAIAKILAHLQKKLPFSPQCEVTLEANPGVLDNQQLSLYPEIGINRISLGVQSFNNESLKRLGRVHNHDDIINAITNIKKNKFKSFNLDIMYGLPGQSIHDSIQDLKTAMQFIPPHFSWYQLTIEPNTVFYSKRPQLPDEDNIYNMEQAGYEILNQHKLTRYETSAFSAPNHQCLHNLNYWQYGDYLGIGAGAHSKITIDDKIIRFYKTKMPKLYLAAKQQKRCDYKLVEKKERIFEFMLNNLRLHSPIPWQRFTSSTQSSMQDIVKQIQEAKDKGLIKSSQDSLIITGLGRRYLNNLTEIFLS